MSAQLTRICRTCQTAKNIDEYYKVRRGRSPHCKPCYLARGKAYAANNRRRIRDTRLQWKYGICLAEYELLCEKQRHKCRICLQAPRPPARLYVDHCHTSGRVRGLLCQLCNSGLGYFRDDQIRLRAAILYLQQ